MEKPACTVVGGRMSALQGAGGGAFLIAVRAGERVKTLRADRSRVVDGPGSQARARSPPGIRSLRITAMAPSRGDVRSSPMAYPAERPLPKLPLPDRPATPTTTDTSMRNRDLTYGNRASSPSDHPA